jgi:hypothetical protein
MGELRGLGDERRGRKMKNNIWKVENENDLK